MLKFSYWLYLTVLLLSPLVFGTIDIWTEAIVETMSALSFFFYILVASKNEVKWRYVPAVIPFLAFLCWNLIQVVPLPLTFVKIVSPATVQVYQDALFGNFPSWLPISLNPFLTLREFFRFSSYFLIYILTIQLLSNRKRLIRTINAIIVVATIISVEAIIQSLTGSEAMYWLRKAIKSDLIFGPFMYKNHFAGYAEMVLPLTLTLFIYYRPKVIYARTWRRRLIDFLNNYTADRYILYGFASSMLTLSLLLSRSRAGIICTLVSIGIMFFAGRKKMKINLNVFAPLLLLAIVFFGTVQIGLQRIDSRFGDVLETDGSTLNGRMTFWKNSFGIIKDFPVTGTGFGTFIDIYPSYNIKNYTKKTSLHNCHNDYLENFTDGGIIAVLLVAWFLVSVFKQALTKFRKRRDKLAVHIFIGSLTGVCALLLHSFFDFQFNLSAAIGLYYFFLMGMMVVASHIKFHGSSETLLTEVHLSSSNIRLLLGATTLLFLSSLVFRVGEFKASQITDVWPPIVSYDTAQNELQELDQKAHRYTRLAPLQFKGHLFRSVVLKSLDRKKEAYEELRKAILCSPANHSLLHIGGFLFSESPFAEKLYNASIQRGKSRPSLYTSYANWLIRHHRAEEAVPLYEKAMELDPARTKHLINIFEKLHLPLELLERALPERVRPHLEFGAYWAKKKDKDRAGKAYLKAMQYVDTEKKLQKGFFLRPFYFFYRNHDDAQALTILKQGISYLPEESALHLALGDLYRRQNMFRLAERAYRQALTLSIDKTRARQRLSQLYTNERSKK